MGHILFWITITIWVFSDLYLVFFRNKKNKAEKSEKKSKYIVFILVLSAIFGAQYIDPTTREVFDQSFNLVRYLSIPLIITGMTVRLIAVIQLGKSFSGNLGVEGKEKLYTDGIYKKIRHPSYLGLLISFSGIAVAFYHPVSSSMVILFALIAFLYRISVEEKILKKEFGQKYIDYIEKTKKLIPYIY